jgi:hypothetical protein
MDVSVAVWVVLRGGGRVGLRPIFSSIFKYFGDTISGSAASIIFQHWPLFSQLVINDDDPRIPIKNDEQDSSHSH